MSRQVEVIRERRKTLRLSVLRTGKVVVRAPIGVSDEVISAFVQKHARWMENRLREHASLTLCDGEKITLAGTEYVIRTGSRAACRDGMLLLPAENRSDALVRLLKRLTRDRMTGFVQEYAQKYGFSYSSVRVSSARGRWGSCSSQKALSFTFRTQFLPDALCRYLAVHELCHTREMNHSKKFWAQVERILPDWRERRKALKSYLWAMNLPF